MPTLHIEHPISDYPTWRQAFDRLADHRQRAGVLAQRVHQPVGDAHFVVIDLDFASLSATEAFLEFLQTKVWSNRDNSPALQGAPQTRILEPAPESLAG